MIHHHHLVIPANPGIQGGKPRCGASLDPRLRGGDGIGEVQ
jgi:hypothetical protein